MIFMHFVCTACFGLLCRHLGVRIELMRNSFTQWTQNPGLDESRLLGSFKCVQTGEHEGGVKHRHHMTPHKDEMWRTAVMEEPDKGGWYGSVKERDLNLNCVRVCVCVRESLLVCCPAWGHFSSLQKQHIQSQEGGRRGCGPMWKTPGTKSSKQNFK